MTDITYRIPQDFAGTTSTFDLAEIHGRYNNFLVIGNENNNTITANIFGDIRLDTLQGESGNDTFAASAYASSYAAVYVNGGTGTDYFFAIDRVDPADLSFSRSLFTTKFSVTGSDGSVLNVSVLDNVEFLVFTDSSNKEYYYLTEDLANNRIRTASFEEVYYRTYGSNEDWYLKGLDTYSSYNTPTTTPASTYTLAPSVASINEGATLTTTVTTTNVASGTVLYYSLSGKGITAADYSAGAITGSGTVGTGGKFSIRHNIANDLTTEGSESIEIKLFTDSSLSKQVGTTASVLIEDTSTTPTKINHIAQGRGDLITTNTNQIDRITLAPATFTSGSPDIITGFLPAEDKIVLPKSVFAKLKSTKLATISSKKQLKKSKSGLNSTQLVYNKMTGEVIYDENGKKKGLGAGGVFARFEDATLPNLTATNFELG